MKITALKKRESLSVQPKLNEIYTQFEGLIDKLNCREFPDKTIGFINQAIAELNATTATGNSLRKLILKKQSGVIKFIEKEHKLVPKNHYRNQWLAKGMAVFGIPIGMTFGAGVGNMGLLAIGLPIGLAIGMAVGSEMDKKAFKEGRQLNTELKSGMC